MSNRIIVVAPHPDDETIACGGIIQKYLEKKSTITIIYITNGENAYSHIYSIYENPSPSELGIIRKEEALRALEILGLSSKDLIFLEFNDGSVAEQYNIIKEKVKKILYKYKPNLVYVPYKNSSHNDHKATFKIVYDAINELGIKVKLYSYLINIKYNRLYFLLLLYLKIKGKKLVIHNISKYSNKKLKAIEQYKSQINSPNPMQNRSVLTNNIRYRLLDRFEFFIRET